MIKKIEKLTPQQEVDLVEFRKKWLDIGLCCEPANFDKAEEQITFFYEKLGKKKPMFFRFSSPLTCELGCHALDYILKNREQFFLDNLRYNLVDSLRANLVDNLRANLWDNLGYNLRDSLRANLWDNLGANLVDNLVDSFRANLVDNLRANLWDNLVDSLRDSLRANLWDNLGANLGYNLWDNLRDNLWDNLGANLVDNKKFFIETWFWGQMDVPWIAFYKFCNDIGVKYKEDDLRILNAWGAISENACWWMPYENICIISDRPNRITKDNAGRLHNESAMAVEFRDGYGLYSWHGVSVPEYVILRPEEITHEKIFAEKNAEVRRVMQERYGFRKFFLDMKNAGKVKQVDQKKDISGLPVTLYAYHDGDITQHFVHVHNGTIESDGTRHEFTINCKNIDNDAFESVMGTYPDMMAILQNHPNRFEILRNAIRT